MGWDDIMQALGSKHSIQNCFIIFWQWLHWVRWWEGNKDYNLWWKLQNGTMQCFSIIFNNKIVSSNEIILRMFNCTNTIKSRLPLVDVDPLTPSSLTVYLLHGPWGTCMQYQELQRENLNITLLLDFCLSSCTSSLWRSANYASSLGPRLLMYYKRKEGQTRCSWKVYLVPCF